ncbi:hypothetical protein FQA39_LY16528 [Lamprigera yunnana]|nr:hypothetical protein FQA39_LY16528 [Lamprigera yunnana]
MSLIDKLGHSQKSNIVLHLGINTPTDIVDVDQTPTPTRFIRNCEEVGLFQDLQNVNPFDETFRKATELTKLGSPHLPPVSTDDSLHTPHIFPHIEEFCLNSDNSNLHVSVNDSTLRMDKKFTNRHTSSVMETSITSSDNDQTLNNNDEMKLKLKCALKNRIKNEEVRGFSELGIDRDKPILLDDNLKLINDNKTFVDDDKKQQMRLERQREINRAAQIRSRKKKKRQFSQLANEVVLLKSEIKKLSKENQMLKEEVLWLKTILVYHKDCQISRSHNAADEINFIKKVVQEKKEKEENYSVKKIIPVQSNPSTFITLAPGRNSLFLQLPSQTKPSIISTLVPKPNFYSIPTKVINIDRPSISNL